jgi:hypothetical protein
MRDWWTGRPWRMIQTNLREIDMLDIDADRFVADLQEFKATVVLLNTAGIIASYPTKLPFHFQSPFLEGDSLEDIIAACHAADIKVLARTDFSKVRRPLYEAHPEWAYVSPRGEIVDYNGDVHVCVNSDYQQNYALKIIEEAVTTLDVDGVFFNMGGYQVRDYSGSYYGICHCGNCRRAFRAMFGLPLPEREDLADPTYRKYSVFKRRSLRWHHEKLYKFMHELRPDLCIANHLEFGCGLVRQESNTAMDRPLPRWQYSASDNTKWVVSSYPDMVSSNTTVDFVDFPYRHVAVSPHQQRLRLVQSLANGGALDYYLIGRLDNHEDRSGYEGIKEVFHYHAAHENEYQDLTSRASIGLVSGPDANRAEFRGWFRFLVEGHFAFDTLVVDAANGWSWDKYEALIIPDYRPLGDALADRLDAFADSGGTIIAVAESGFRDDEYEARCTPALRCLGVEEVRAVRPDMRSSYFRLERKEQFKRLAATDLIYMDGDYVYARYTASVAQHLKLIPPHMFGPPERCYYTHVTEHPGFTINPSGQGRGVYFPWRPGSLYYGQGHTNTLDFVVDLLENGLGLRPFGGNLSPMVEVTLFERRDGSYELLHLVNASGHFGTTFFAPVVMTDIQVCLEHTGTPRSITSLVTGEEHGSVADDQTLTINVPRLELFEAIKIVR